MRWTTDPTRIEDLLYYLHLMEGRNFTGSIIVWMYGGRISRNTLTRLHRQLHRAGIPVDDHETEDAPHAQAEISAS